MKYSEEQDVKSKYVTSKLKEYSSSKTFGVNEWTTIKLPKVGRNLP